jgi:DNA replication and repair protein RecF
VNLLHGPNGIGKTNVLEAIHYLCLAKSFLAGTDRHALRKGEERFQVDAEVVTDRRGAQQIRIIFVPGEGKRVLVNGVVLDRLTDLVGQFPVVVLAPADHKLTEEGPDERRRFLDTMLCQASPAYLQALVAYRRVLKQRNQLLASRRGMRQEMMASYNEAFARHGSRLMTRRARFIREFSEHLETAYALMSETAERPSITYRTFLAIKEDQDESELAARFVGELQSRFSEECERGMTTVGPHRDDLLFQLGALPVRRYASQGQHRTFVMALKLAQYFYLGERLGEQPLLLLDDVFDTLDPHRMKTITGLLAGDAVGQSLVTAARPDLFDKIFTFAEPGSASIAIQPGPGPVIANTQAQ